MKLLVVLLAALALASAANAQQQRCPLTAADVSGLDFKPVAPACNGELARSSRPGPQAGPVPEAANCPRPKSTSFPSLLQPWEMLSDI
jgi:hypothetical protein